MSTTSRQPLHIVDLQTDERGHRISETLSLPQRMAAAMIDIKKKNGACMPQDLNALGFTTDDVVTHWDAAHLLIKLNQ